MSSREKQNDLAKKRLLKRLKKKHGRTRPPSSLPANVKLIRDYPGAEKMSEVLLDFVEPLVGKTPSEKELRPALMVAIMAWNLASAPAQLREKLIQDAEQAIPAEMREGVRGILGLLVLHKLTHFADNRRLILDFTLTMRPSGPYLEVTSTLPDEKPKHEGPGGGL